MKEIFRLTLAIFCLYFCFSHAQEIPEQMIEEQPYHQPSESSYESLRHKRHMNIENQLNHTISKFLSAFEKRFADYLVPPDRYLKTFEGRSQLIIRNTSIVCVGEKKFSDWDIHYWVNTEKITLPILKSMSLFIMTFSGFNCASDFVSCSEHHRKVCQYIKHTPYIQFMAFMPKESTAPFVDIHISKVSRGMKEEYYLENCESYEENFVNWSILTYWRKLKNGKHEDFIMQDYILPSFELEDQNEIKSNPVSFFKKHFQDNEKFVKPVRFLTRKRNSRKVE